MPTMEKVSAQSSSSVARRVMGTAVFGGVETVAARAIGAWLPEGAVMVKESLKVPPAERWNWAVTWEAVTVNFTKPNVGLRLDPMNLVKYRASESPVFTV